MENKIIAVIGATGAQGGGLVRAIVKDAGGGFRARAITRNINSEKARALADLGAEVVAADLENPRSLHQAFAGAHGAYCVTFFWEHFSPEKELTHARRMAEAAQAAGVDHVVWSTLEDTRKWVPLEDNRMPTLMGKYKVPHFDAKGEADGIFSKLGLPLTILRTSFYWDNLIHFGMEPKKDEKGILAFTMPMGNKRLPGIAAEDIGKCVYGIFKRGKDLIGRTIGIAGEFLTGSQMADALGRAIGQKVRYNDIDPAVYRGLGFPGAEDLGNMFQFKRDFNDIFCGARSLELSLSLNPDLQTFDIWLARNIEQIPIQR